MGGYKRVRGLPVALEARERQAHAAGPGCAPRLKVFVLSSSFVAAFVGAAAPAMRAAPMPSSLRLSSVRLSLSLSASAKRSRASSLMWLLHRFSPTSDRFERSASARCVAPAEPRPLSPRSRCLRDWVLLSSSPTLVAPASSSLLRESLSVRRV